MTTASAKSQPLQEPLEKSLDQDKAEAFAHKMIGVLNNAGLALMASIGHRTGLLAVMSKMKPSSSADIARRATLNERYVREWLGAMVTGGIVEFDPDTGTYWLPQEHSAFLTPAASPNNLAVTTQFISVLGGVEDQIVDCFRHGGGVPYSGYGRFQEVMAEESDQTTRGALLDAILPLVPGLDERLRDGISVLDVGCGSGRALNLLAKTYPASRFTGYDFSSEAIGRAKKDAAATQLDNAHFQVKDVAMLEEENAYDLITAFDAIHDQARPAEVLRGIANTLKPDGIFLMQEIAGSSFVQNNLSHPLGPFCYTISCMHCMTVSLAQGGDGLGAMWGEEKARAMLNDAGLHPTQVSCLPHDILNIYYVVEKAGPQTARRVACLK